MLSPITKTTVPNSRMSATETELQNAPSARLKAVLQAQPDAEAATHQHSETQESELDNAVSVIPDGGRDAWLVVLGCAIMTFWFNGFTYSWGVIQAELVQSGFTSASTLSWVGSLSVTICVLLGLLSVRVLRRLGARTSGMLGTALIGTGLICSGFTTSSVGGLFGTSGVLLGCGFSLCFMVSSIVPSQYFSNKIGLANGIVKLGGGIGGTVLALALEALIERVGTAWTFRITGILTLATGMPAAWAVKERTPIRTPFIEWSLFKSLPFVAVFAAGATGTFAIFVPPFFLPLFAQSIGLSASTGAGLVAAFNACTAIGRFGSGYFCDKFGALNTFFCIMLLNAISMWAIWPVSETLAPLIIFAMLNGVANGSFFTTFPTVITTMFGPTRGAVAMAMTVTGWSGGYLLGAPIAGYLLQASGGQKAGNISPYRPAIFYAGGVAFASSAFVLLARLKIDKKLIKKI